ncbi:ISAs1 family transposase [Flavobacterium cupreum]|uniref:ISAs1 family transposase n=2 Tax=Flavobacterium cupreum TaxID=2133766 RepID=A0A433ZZZ4_9FLAO|nr:ISAs1 family transposase [Flavobacterium cupreum]
MPEPRVEGRTTHRLIDILVLTICAVVAGADDWEHVAMWGEEKIDWLRQFVKLDHGIPSHDTIGRVFSLLDADCFQACFVRWVSATCTSLAGEVVAIDGKTMRGSQRRRLGKNAIHVVSAFASGRGITLGQLSTDTKSNEITAIPKLLDMLDVSGSTVTIDAMGCQVGIAAKIVEKGAHYLLGLKGNQGKLAEQVEDFFDIAERERYRNLDAVEDIVHDKGHGRVETRRCVALPARHLENTDAWSGLGSMVMVESMRFIDGKESCEKRYYISSMAPDSRAIGAAIRAHWGVENQLHWRLDVTFGEDACRVRVGNAAENFNVVRKIVMNLLKADTSRKLTMAKKRQLAALNTNFLGDVLGLRSNSEF